MIPTETVQTTESDSRPVSQPEEAARYTALFRAEKDDIGSENTCFWNVNTE